MGSCLRKYGRFEHNVVKYFTEQILSGLEYLHLKGILHRVSFAWIRVCPASLTSYMTGS